MELKIKQLMADLVEIRDNELEHGPQWNKINDIIVDLSFYPDNAKIVVEDTKDKQEE